MALKLGAEFGSFILGNKFPRKKELEDEEGIRDQQDDDSFSYSLRGLRAMQPTLVFLPGESHGQRSLAGYSL